jgi:tetratricopeptide (TPR) repeat protein/O-antigen ligase
MQTIKNILKYAVLSGLFVIPFIPFIVPTAMFFPFITGKGFTFRILVEIIFGLYAVLAFWDAAYRPKMSWITKSVLLFTLITFIADIFSVNPYKSLWSNYERMEGFVLIAHLAAYYIAASSMLSVSRWKKLLDVSIFASVLESFYGLFQLLGWATINQGGVRLDGTFGNASYLAIYLVFHIFLSAYMLLNSPQMWKKWLYALIAVFETAILYFTATRGAILGLIGGIFLAGLIVVFKEKENARLRKFAYYVFGAILVLILGFFAVRNTAVVQKSPVLSRFSTLSLAEFKTQGRYFVWPMAIKGVKEHPILGWGQESFNFVFNKYYDPRMIGQEEWFDRTHDIFLDWLINGGILGFLAYFSMYAALLYCIWRKDSKFRVSEKAVFTGLIAAYLFHNAFVFDNLVSYILFFSVLAYVHVVSTEGAVSTKKFYTAQFSQSTVAYTVLPITLIATILAVYFVNVPALSANRTLIQAISPQGDVEKNLELFKKVYEYGSFGSTEATEQLVTIASQVQSADLPDTTKQEFYAFAKQKIEEKIAETPTDARYLVFAGSFFNRFAQYDLAITYLERAIAQSPKKQSIYFELATSYLGKQDYQKALSIFKEAYDLAPNLPESKNIYALGAIYAKDTAVLQQLSSQLDPQTVISDNRFLNAYAAIGDYQSVINILTTRLGQDPKNAQYKLSLASAYATIGQKQKAISLINEIIADNPSFKDQGEQYIQQLQ